MNAHWQDSKIVARFRKYAVRGDGCWAWRGSVKTDPRKRGYGQLQIQRENVRKWYRAYVLSWEIENRRDWPNGAIARHSCDNPNCVNPAHISPGSHMDNVADKMARGRHFQANMTHCKNGHPLSGEHLYIARNGARRCYTCLLRQGRERKARLRSERLEMAR